MGSYSEQWRKVLEALRAKPAGLLTDMDGTLSPIVPTPEDATVHPAMAKALHSLTSKLDLVGIVTGRAPENSAAIVGLDNILYIGNHGMEDLANGTIRALPGTAPLREEVRSVLDGVERRVPIPGVLFENKRVSGTVHYRTARNPKEASKALLPVLEELVKPTHLEIRQGRMSYELRPRNDPGKGGAVERIVAAHGLRGCVFIGDDATDTDGFRALHKLRADTGIQTAAIGVLSEETPQVVIETADVLVEGTEGVLALLQWLNEQM